MEIQNGNKIMNWRQRKIKVKVDENKKKNKVLIQYEFLTMRRNDD